MQQHAGRRHDSTMGIVAPGLHVGASRPDRQHTPAAARSPANDLPFITPGEQKVSIRGKRSRASLLLMPAEDSGFAMASIVQMDFAIACGKSHPAVVWVPRDAIDPS